jgi:hypothetical protein
MLSDIQDLARALRRRIMPKDAATARPEPYCNRNRWESTGRDQGRGMGTGDQEGPSRLGAECEDDGTRTDFWCSSSRRSSRWCTPAPADSWSIMLL